MKDIGMIVIIVFLFYMMKLFADWIDNFISKKQRRIKNVIISNFNYIIILLLDLCIDQS